MPLDTSSKTAPSSICVYTRAWRTSGTGLFAQELVDGLLKSGVKVTFVSPVVDNAEMEQPRDGLRRLRPVREFVTPALLPVRALRSFIRIFGSIFYLLLARVNNRTFIITIPDPLAFFIPTLFLLRLTRARIIFIAHDPVPHCWRFSKRWRRFEKFAHESCYRLSDTIVVLSEATRLKLLEFFPHVRKPVEVIEHGDFAFRRVTPPPGNGGLLVFGTLRRNKGVLEAIAGCIAAHAAGAPIRLVVAGEPYREEPGYAEQCRDLAATAPEAITLRMGYVDDADLPGLFAECDALVMPYTEFFSQSGVALLAASNARPIIASRAGGIAALIDEGMPSVVVAHPITAENVFTAVMKFRETPNDEWVRRCMEYRDLTLQRRSWKVIAGRYAALAKSLGG
ncbi:MAG: glycosyltransferase family 4 protein [Sphingobium sp.]